MDEPSQAQAKFFEDAPGEANAEERVVETDLDFYIVSYVDNAPKLIGAPRWELKPGFNVLDYLSREDRKRALDHAARCYAGEEVGQVQYVAQNRDGESFPVLVEPKPIFEGGVPQGLRLLIKDTGGGRRDSEAERNRYKEQLTQLQKSEALSLLSSGVAHDVNNVLGVISTIAGSASHQLGEDHPQSEDLEGIIKACRRGAALTQELLKFARHEPDRLERFSVNNQVEEVEFLLKHMVGSQVMVEVILESEPTFVKGNPSLFNHALINICLNGVRAMDSVGALKLTTRREDLTADRENLPEGLKAGVYVSVEIADTGTGMDAETKDRAFEPFFTTRPRGKGTGLGLPMVRQTVERHHGVVNLSSEPGKGTAVTIHLPADDRQSVPSVKETLKEIAFPSAAPLGLDDDSSSPDDGSFKGF